MQQKTRAQWAIWGSIVAIIGFFLPWAVISVPRVGSVSVNGPDLDLPVVWGIFVTSGIILIIGWATSEGANEFVNILQRFLHVGQSFGFLVVFFKAMNDGTLTRAAQEGVFAGSGYSLSGYYVASGTHVDFGIGFWVVVIGLTISAIGVYSKEE
jgi:heme/copper-type cytochrome/quinol oxidase subunit 3